MSSSEPRRTAALLGLALALAPALAAWACPVCFGEAEAPVLDGARWSVLFLGGLVYLLIGGAVGAFFVIRRHARRQMERSEDPHRGLKLVGGASDA